MKEAVSPYSVMEKMVEKTRSKPPKIIVNKKMNHDDRVKKLNNLGMFNLISNQIRILCEIR